MRVAWFSALAGAQKSAPSVSAYASELLLPYLTRELEIEVFTASREESSFAPTFHYLQAFERHQRQAFDIFFYQLEDRKEAAFARVHCALQPGAIWFHDYFFSDFGPEPILNSPWQHIVRTFTGEDSSWPERLAEQPQLGPQGVREASFAALALFSNERSHDEYRRGPALSLYEDHDTPSYFIPCPAAQPRRNRNRDAFTVGFLGSPRVEHRAHKLLLALQNLSARGAQIQLLWLLDAEERESASRLARQFSGIEVDFRVGRSARHWEECLSGIDAAVHTLFSVYGQPQPYLSLSLRAGVPTLATRFGQVDYLADSVLFKIRPGHTEALEMEEVLAALVGQEPKKAFQGTPSFAHEMYEPQAVAQEILHILSKHQARLADCAVRWESFQRQAREALLGEVAGFFPEFPGDKEKLLSSTLTEPVFQELGWRS